MISIIGGGPSGAYLASLLKDEEVRVFEEHGEIGMPVQCTGILTSKIKELLSLKREFIVNRIKRMKLISPNKEECEFELKDEDLVIDRRKFDSYLIERAKDKGAEFFLNHKLLDLKIGEAGVDLKFRGKEIRTDVLVGADGVSSFVGRKLGMERSFRVGYQYRVKGDYEKELVKVYFLKGGFGWIVPEDEKVARVGMVKGEFVGEFYSFLKKIGVREKDFLECQSGLIPAYDGSGVCRDGVYLVGDGAGHVKATSLGGIVYGMRGAKVLARVLNHGGDYEKELKRVKRELWLHSKVADFLGKFEEGDYDDFVKVLRKVDLGKFNRDKPWSGLGLFLKPSLVGFLAKRFLK